LPKYADEHLAGSLRQLAELLVIVWCQKKTLEMQKKSKKEEQSKAKCYAQQKSADILRKLENQQAKQHKHFDSVCIVNCLC